MIAAARARAPAALRRRLRGAPAAPRPVRGRRRAAAAPLGAARCRWSPARARGRRSPAACRSRWRAVAACSAGAALARRAARRARPRRAARRSTGARSPRARSCSSRCARARRRRAVARVRLAAPRAVEPAETRRRARAARARAAAPRRGVTRWRVRRRRVAVGAEVALRGTVAALAAVEALRAPARRARGPRRRRVRADGRRRGGLAGALDARARAGGARPRRAACRRPRRRCCAAWCSARTRRSTRRCATSSERSGLAHLLAVSRPERAAALHRWCSRWRRCVGVAAARAAARRCRARRALRAARRRRAVDPARGRDGRRRAGRALAGRPASRWYALGLAAAVTLALNPRAAGEPGWQLSFAAVVGLLALAPRLRERARRARLPDAGRGGDRRSRSPRRSATAPLLALHFEQVSLVSLPANLLAAPVVAPSCGSGCSAIAVGAGRARARRAAQRALRAAARLPGVGRARGARRARAPRCRCGSAGRRALAAALRGARAAAGWLAARARPARAARRRARRSAAAACARSPPPRSLVAARRRRRARRPLAAAVAPGELVVSFLDVGQGDATLLQTTATRRARSTPGRRAARSCAGCARPASSGSTCSCSRTPRPTTRAWRSPVIARHRPRLVLDGGAGWPTAVQPRLAARGAARAAAGCSRRARASGSALGPLRARVLWPPPPPPGWRPRATRTTAPSSPHVRDGAFDLLLPADAESNVTARARPAAGRGAQGRPPRQRRRGPAGAARARCARGSPRSRSARATRYGHPTPSTLGARSAPCRRVVRTDRDGDVAPARRRGGRHAAGARTPGERPARPF